jgi:metal-responsive CopG/Arc/MetJ family transcriptional regulator
MSEGRGAKKPERGDRKEVTVMLPAELHQTLAEFCREQKVSRDLVVERALTEYFREGDMSH